MDLPKAYDPKSVEPKWAEKWAKNPFVANPKSGKPPFVIFMPPPNVTGSLHMGPAVAGGDDAAHVLPPKAGGGEHLFHGPDGAAGARPQGNEGAARNAGPSLQ